MSADIKTVPTQEQRKEAERIYSVEAFDFVANPIGSRDWFLFWHGYQAALEAAPASSASAQAVDANGRLDNFMRGVIAALGVMANHGFRHGTVYHDEIVRSVGEADLYAVAEAEDYEWAGLNKRKKPRKQSQQSPVQASDAGRQG